MTTKFCKDCRHSGYQAMLAYAAQHGFREWHCPAPSKAMPCYHPAAVETDLVTGVGTPERAYIMRAGRLCGEAGKLWEAPDDAQHS